MLDRPRLRPDGTMRPSLDLRSATIGKDLLCVGGFVATGGVRVRVMEARKSAQFVDARLGTTPATSLYALNAYGLVTTDLVVEPAVAPGGAVRLTQARVASFSDSPLLWDAQGGFLIDGFDYQLMNDAGADLRERLARLERAVPDYAPGPYDQLAAAYRRAGHRRRRPSAC